MATYLLFTENKSSLAPVTQYFGISQDAVILLIIAIWIGYVLLMGLLATIISMHQNLSAMAEKLAEISAKMPETGGR